MDFEGREMLTLFGLPENSIYENAFLKLDISLYVWKSTQALVLVMFPVTSP